MNLFKPSKKILETICVGEELLYNYEIYPRGEGKFNEEMQRLFLTKLYSSIIEFYKIEFKVNILNKQKVYDVSLEALKNCYDHGPKNKEILSGLFLGDKGVCHGFCDGGAYFKNEKIKKQYENKIEIINFDKKTLKNNFQCGINEHIYSSSDLIEIDSEKGVLYCVQLKQNILIY